jgi:hypothetical protein
MQSLGKSNRVLGFVADLAVAAVFAEAIVELLSLRQL